MTTEEMAVRLTEVNARSSSNTKRIDALEKRQTDSEKMLNSIALIAQRQDSMDGDVKEIKADVKALAAKPGKMWSAVVQKVVLGIVAALVIYCMARLGLG